jgi:hypothetical protein
LGFFLKNRFLGRRIRKCSSFHEERYNQKAKRNHESNGYYKSFVNSMKHFHTTTKAILELLLITIGIIVIVKAITVAGMIYDFFRM